MKGDSVYIIAEAGVNHNGSIDMAKELILAAKDAGADCVKFQTWITDELVSTDAPKASYQQVSNSEESQYEMLRKLELAHEDFAELKKFAEISKIDFLSTPDERKSLDFLCDVLHIPLLKIGSGEVNNLLFLKEVAAKKTPVILSTGMSTLGEVERARTVLLGNGAPSVALLHCTSEYPAPYNSVNLKAMDTLSQAFGCVVGYSDHTPGIEISLAAVARGARIIEKHFTLDQSLPGPDHQASLNPHELKTLVDGIRKIEVALGDGVKQIQEAEANNRSVVRKGLYAACDLSAGVKIQEFQLVGKRPAKGIPAESYELIIGKHLRCAIAKGEPIHFHHISFEES